MKHLLIILSLLFYIGCDEDKDEFSLQGTWVSLSAKMNGSNSPSLLFNPSSNSFTIVEKHLGSSHNCYCYYNWNFEQISGDNYTVSHTNGEGNYPFIIEVLENGNISITFDMFEYGEKEFIRESDDILSFEACSTNDCE